MSVKDWTKYKILLSQYPKKYEGNSSENSYIPSFICPSLLIDFSFGQITLDKSCVNMVAYIHSEYDRNAMMRNSTCGLERRELPGGARQRKGTMELAPEQLSELREESRRRRCPPLKGEDIRIPDGSRIPECMKLFINKSGTAKEVIFRLLQTICRDGRFFYFTGKSFIMAFRKTGGKIYDECEEISETVLYAAC